MKPDWKDAPEWAQWLAMDPDGSWWWFEHEPIVEFDEWISTPVGEYLYAGENGSSGDMAKEWRP
jgi:hypothetical protein